MTEYRGVKGVKDILPPESGEWRALEAKAVEYFERYGFFEIKIPIFEKTNVFLRSLGDTTDIVEKEMYTFTDRGGESLTLRPEGTASVVRSYVEHKLYSPPGVTKLFYSGPMFRCERPQAGRYRQFYQIGAEVFGTSSPDVDAETLSMFMEYLGSLQLKSLTLHLNSLGCAECRPGYRDALIQFTKERLTRFCENCCNRYEINPLRIFDCKAKGCKEATEGAPVVSEYLCDECEGHFDQVKNSLSLLKVEYTLNPRLVRGLDYYTKTAFEVTAEGLGAQNAIAGGGRYDKLAEELGGPPTPAFGFAMGVERTLSLIEKPLRDVLQPHLFIAALGEQADRFAFTLAGNLRRKGVRVERDYAKAGLKSQLKKANRAKALYALMIGDNEITSGKAMLKNMDTGDQEEIEIIAIGERILKTLSLS